MDGIRELYKIGRGPSSSHTMGPGRAAGLFLAHWPVAAAYRVTLYGSLVATGRDMQREYRETGAGGLARFQPR